MRAAALSRRHVEDYTKTRTTAAVVVVEEMQTHSEPWLTQHRRNQIALALAAVGLVLAWFATSGLNTQAVLHLLY